MNGMPVPVHHAVRPVGQMAEGLQAQLSLIGCPLRKALGLRLDHQVIVLFQRAGQAAAEGDLLARQLLLGRVVDITARNGERLCRLKMIHIRLHAEGMALPGKVKVVGDELIRAAVFPHDLRLAQKKIRHLLPLERLKGAAKASVDGSDHAWKFLPGIDPVAPVIQAEIPVQPLQVAVITLSHVAHKHLLHVLAAGTEMLGFIVQLEADDAGIALHRLHQLSDDALREKAVGRMGDVHDLSCAIGPSAASVRHHHLRVGLRHPGRDGIGGRSHNHGNARLLTGLQHPCHMGKIKHALLRLLAAPGGFRDPDHVDSGLFHHGDIRIQPVIRHIFVVICRSV